MSNWLSKESFSRQSAPLACLNAPPCQDGRGPRSKPAWTAFSRLGLLLPGSMLISAWLLSGCGAQQETEALPVAERVQPVEVAPVAQQDLRETLLVVGSVTANESTTIRPEISGSIRQIHFQEGQRVEDGQLLLELDDREPRAQLREATARLQLAQQTFDRNEALWASQSIPQAERDRTAADLERAHADVEMLQVRVERSAIRAPFAGTVGSRNVSPGDLVGPSDVISQLEDLSRLKVDFTLPERHSERIEPGSRILLHIGTGNNRRTLPGVVYFVSPVIDRATRSVEVKAYVEEASASLRPGMFVQVEVVLEEKENVLTVPETAILAREGSHFLVTVERDGEGRETVGYRPVRLGLRQAGLVEVIPLDESALAAGQEVVAAGVGALPLFPGARVESRPLKAIFAESGRS